MSKNLSFPINSEEQLPNSEFDDESPFIDFMSGTMMAALNGDLEGLKKILSLAKTAGGKLNMLRAHDYNTFKMAVAKGHDHIIEYIVSLMTTEEIVNMVSTDEFYSFVSAAQEGHLGTLMYLSSLLQDTPSRYNALHTLNEAPFKQAAAFGHLHILKYIVQYTSAKDLSYLLHNNNNETFCGAAENGQLHVLKYMVELTPSHNKFRNMVHAMQHLPFRLAAEKGDIPVMNYLMEMTPFISEQYKMIHSHCNITMLDAIRDNQIDVVKYILQFDLAHTPTPDQEFVMDTCLITIDHRTRGQRFQTPILAIMREARAQILEDNKVYNYGINNGHSFPEINSNFPEFRIAMEKDSLKPVCSAPRFEPIGGVAPNISFVDRVAPIATRPHTGLSPVPLTRQIADGGFVDMLSKQFGCGASSPAL